MCQKLPHNITGVGSETGNTHNQTGLGSPARKSTLSIILAIFFAAVFLTAIATTALPVLAYNHHHNLDIDDFRHGQSYHDIRGDLHSGGRS